MLCWVNGQYIEEAQVSISPFDHGFLYGIGFYELFRTYNGQVLFLKERYNRLCTALNHYRIPITFTLADLQEAVTQLTKDAEGEDTVLRLNVSAGQNENAESMAKAFLYKNPNVLMFRTPLIPRNRGKEKKGRWLKTVRNTPEQQPRYVSHHFGNNLLAKLEIENSNLTEGFYLNTQGFVAEGITSNIFWAKDGILYTPSLASGIIPGITRHWVIVMAEQLGIRLVEDQFIKKELESAYECFITNSIDELVPISNIGRVKFLGGDGPIYQRLHQAYIEEIIQMMKRG